MNVGIVGAGMCGLAAARYLHRSGHQVTVYEKSKGVGGRLATRRQNGFVWDTGATSIAPRGKSIEQVMLHELDTDGLIAIEKPIYTHSGLRVTPGHASGTPRYTYRDGNTTFAKRLCEGIDVRLSTQVDEIEKIDQSFRIGTDVFDALILTPPIPQSGLLLWNIGESRPMANVRYRPCISIVLGFQAELPTTNYHALLDVEQVHPLTWVCLESVKSPNRAPEGCSALGLQFNSSFSHSQYERADESLIETAVSYVERLYGPSFQTPMASSVMRWKYSQPESLATFEHVNPPGSKLLIASDALLGGHVEDAFEIGTRVAKQLVEED